MATITATHLDAPTRPAQGSTFKRCTCPVSKGCLLDHGSWSFIADVGVNESTGKRKQVKRGGFPTQEAAQEALAVFVDAMASADHHPTRSNFYWIAAAELLTEDLQELALSRHGDGFVYVVSAGTYLKIGYSKHPERRLSEIRQRPSGTRNLIEPADLDRRSATSWLALPGSRADEKALHWLARNYHAAGEWFRADRALLDCLSRLWATGSDTEQVAP